MKVKSLNKYVIFMLDKTMFGVPVMKTREIVEYGKITPVPEAPEFIKGVINLRGQVVPVIDLSRKFFGIDTKIQESTSVMIVEVALDNEINFMGLTVDNVKDVLEINDDKLENSPKYGSKMKSEYIQNVASYNDDFILILDIDKVISNIKISENMKDAVENKNT
jgi:purine-binding chemotaxis protein CheW